MIHCVSVDGKSKTTAFASGISLFSNQYYCITTMIKCNDVLDVEYQVTKVFLIDNIIQVVCGTTNNKSVVPDTKLLQCPSIANDRPYKTSFLFQLFYYYFVSFFPLLIMTYAPDSSNMPTLVPPPAGRGLGSNNKRRGPGLKLSFEHLQTPPASSITAVDPATQHNNTFREKVGNIVGNSSRSAQSSLTQSSSDVNVNHVKRTYPGCGADDEDDDGDDSLAAAYLNAVRQTTPTAAMATTPPSTTERRNIPVLREPPQPPATGPRRSPNTTTTHHHHHHVPVSSTTTSTSTSNATPVSPFSSSSSSSASDANDPDGSHCMDIKTEDLEVIKLLGEGAAGTVRKVLHRPSGRIMAKKVDQGWCEGSF